MDKEELKELIMTTIKEEEPFMNSKNRAAAAAATKTFLFRLGLRITDDQISHDAYRKVYQLLLGVSDEITAMFTQSVD